MIRLTTIISVLAFAGLGAAGCGGGGDSTSVAGFDAGAGVDGVRDCLTAAGWSETGKSTGTSGTAYTIDSDSGTSVLVSTDPVDQILTDSTTFAIPASDPGADALSVEVIIGTISDEERGQINDCAGG